jgi:hypothetical protein
MGLLIVVIAVPADLAKGQLAAPNLRRSLPIGIDFGKILNGNGRLLAGPVAPTNFQTDPVAVDEGSRVGSAFPTRVGSWLSRCAATKFEAAQQCLRER